MRRNTSRDLVDAPPVAVRDQTNQTAERQPEVVVLDQPVGLALRVRPADAAKVVRLCRVALPQERLRNMVTDLLPGRLQLAFARRAAEHVTKLQGE